MSKSTPRYKLCRRLGAAIHEKCQTEKYSPTTGKTSKGAPKRPTEYSKQLTEKQKVRFTYGLSERQFKNYVSEAMNAASPARALFELLERRLDSIAYRIGFAPTRLAARQFVSHGHTTVDGRRVDIPSYRTSLGQVISIREATRSSKMFENRVESFKGTKSPEWLSVDQQKFTATVAGQPANPDPMLDFQAVIEFYTR